ncbi:BrnA antitoxin family protein [Pseudomonas sp. Y24-6]|uniref:BrnA antitoxin family protein n=1 Tax=Pseudomonas sp. Y24-6 TaxID=2750013 RepID=UPI001CE1E05C|nr:BrnA antitoxin family protein [Pseudomonas sp. Y24-6]MCA4964767.1 BrnA antitoxin family protein [Pseudomonas sp. Y24-6]
MKNEYDFSHAKRGAIASTKGKTRITIMLDDVVIAAARALAESEGYGYQTVINNTLRQALLSETSSACESDPRSAIVNAGHFKEGLKPCELLSLEKKLVEALSEIQRVLKP